MAGKAISSLKVLADSKSYPIDITLDNGLVMLSSPDDKGRAVMPADIEGEVNRVRIDGKEKTFSGQVKPNGMFSLPVAMLISIRY